MYLLLHCLCDICLNYQHCPKEEGGRNGNFLMEKNKCSRKKGPEVVIVKWEKRRI